MQHILKLKDKRVNATNISFQISIGDYVEMAEQILANNMFQRKRVKSSTTVYALLKEDLKVGCVMPPLVLAIESDKDESNIIDKLTDQALVINHMKENINKLLILDGLQRTNTLIDLISETTRKGDQALLDSLKKNMMRIELYIGVNRLSILYRMLTLNTGQTPMSLRHQIEILYSDYIKIGINEIKLLLEVNAQRVSDIKEYKFSDVIDGFTSYIERNELAIDRLDILENIKGLEKLSKENQSKDLFKSFIETFHLFLTKNIDIANRWKLDADYTKSYDDNPFGTDVQSIFKKNQVLTGFGAAAGKLIDNKKINDFDDLKNKIQNIKFNNDAKTDYSLLLKALSDVKKTANKIGNAQRMYFQYFFRELFNEDTDAYLNIGLASSEAFKKYQSQI